jgi:lysophospholipase L1-like esterase
MAIREPEKEVSVINKGIGGNRITNLQERWTDDVIKHKPGWLSIKIGINDLHSYLKKMDEAVSPDDFEKCYEEILSRTVEKLPGCNILLISPFYISKETSQHSFRHKVLELLPEYIDTVKRMSEKFGTRYIDTHAIFQDLLKYHEADYFCPEPVHPYPCGHLAIAEAVYRALS